MSRTNVPYLSNLTSIRGIGSILVVIVHAHLFIHPLLPARASSLFYNSYVLVDIFFIMSGFVISHVYTSKFENGFNFASFKKYIGARFARVYPIHFVTSLWAFAACIFILRYTDNVSGYFREMINPKALPASLLFIQSMHLYTAPQLNVSSWSLGAEWWMYIVFPFFLPVFYRLRATGRVITCILLLLSFAAMYYLLGPNYGLLSKGVPNLNLVSDFGFFRCAAGFLTGMLFYELYRDNVGFKFFKKDWVFIVCLIGILAVMHYNWNMMIVFALLPVLLLSAAYNDTFIFKILTPKPLMYLGDLSFSIYMIHMPVVFTYYIYRAKQAPTFLSPGNAFNPNTGGYLTGWWYCLILVAVTLTLSVFTYQYLEVPARNYFNKLFSTKRPKVVAEELTAGV